MPDILGRSGKIQPLTMRRIIVEAFCVGVKIDFSVTALLTN
jgi:hypothetical protein